MVRIRSYFGSTEPPILVDLSLFHKFIVTSVTMSLNKVQLFPNMKEFGPYSSALKQKEYTIYEKISMFADIFVKESRVAYNLKFNMIADLNMDERLLKRLGAGDENAFAQVFDQYHRLLYALAYRYLKSMEDAEDAVQYTFMKLWEQHRIFDFSTGVRSLLFTILKNYILNELRHQRIVLEKQYEMAQAGETVEPDFTEMLADNDLKKHLYDIIDCLPGQKREVCLLKIEQGLSNQEIADKMQISVPTVKSHYTQAIKILRSGIGKLISLILIKGLSVLHII